MLSLSINLLVVVLTAVMYGTFDSLGLGQVTPKEILFLLVFNHEVL